MKLFEDEYTAGNDKSRKVVKVLFGIPNEGNTLCEAYDNRLEMAIHMGVLQTLSNKGVSQYCGVDYDIPGNVEYQFSLATVGKVLTPIARERIAETAVAEGFDYLFMVDDDMLAPADLFERLLRHNVDIVAPLAFTRHTPHRPVIYNLDKGFNDITKKRCYSNYPVINYPKDQLVKCDAVGFGAVLIKVEILRQMRKPWFMTTSGAGEDIHFCHMAGEQGFKVYMDTATKLTHLGYPKHVDEAVYEDENNLKELRKEYGDQRKYNN